MTPENEKRLTKRLQTWEFPASWCGDRKILKLTAAQAVTAIRGEFDLMENIIQAVRDWFTAERIGQKYDALDAMGNALIVLDNFRRGQ